MSFQAAAKASGPTSCYISKQPQDQGTGGASGAGGNIPTPTNLVMQPQMQVATTNVIEKQDWKHLLDF